MARRRRLSILALLLSSALPSGTAGANSPCDVAIGAWRWPDGSHVTLRDDFKLEARAAAGGAPVLAGDWWCNAEIRAARQPPPGELMGSGLF